MRNSPVSYQPGPEVPFGRGRSQHDWLARGACNQPGVDPQWFTSDEDDLQAVEAARQVCRGCPVINECWAWASQTNPYGVYAAETYIERTRRLQLEQLDRRGGAA